MTETLAKCEQHGPELIGSHVTLRPPTASELERIQELMRDPQTAHFLNIEESVMNGVSSGAQEHILLARFANIQARLDISRTIGKSLALCHEPILSPLAYRKLSTMVELVFAVVSKEDGAFAGFIALQVSTLHLRGTIRTVIEQGYRERGVGTEAKRLVLDYGFGVLRLEKMCSVSVRENATTQRINRQLGFRREAVLRKHARIGDRYHDLICMGILRDEYLARK